jgi:hypothetical protein
MQVVDDGSDTARAGVERATWQKASIAVTAAAFQPLLAHTQLLRP